MFQKKSILIEYIFGMNHLDESAKWVFENQFLPLLDVIHRINSLKIPSNFVYISAICLQFRKKDKRFMK